ncbi:hypothetical protein LUZ60_017634 [Juncus effusus]|nr:hypothetical protein LUZ60_017634 [Juncus effusus]
MHAFSPADGFFTVKEGVDEMIKNLANEPSVGLYFVQQHAQSSMPNLLSVQEKVSEKVREVTLHTEDIEDSICVVKSMEEFGLPIADEMIKDINKSLLIINSSQPKRGLIENPSWGFQFTRSGSNIPESSDSTGSSSRNYFTSMFKSAKQKAASFKWTSSQDLIVTDNKGTNSEAMMSPLMPPTDQSDASAENSGMSDNAALLEDYDKFKLEQELKLREWLEGLKGDETK